MARMPCLALAILACAGFASSASGASGTFDCDQLQDALDQATDGDVITLAEGLVCHGGWTLKDDTRITLQGAGTGATLDGDGVNQILDGFSVGQSTISNLTFINGSTGEGSGGAIYLNGDSPVTISDNHFRRNRAAFGRGGAVYIDQYTPSVEPSAAASRSARSIENGRIVLSKNVFGGPDQADGNLADETGGGLSLSSDDYPVTLSGNSFVNNAAGRDGGGAWVSTCGTTYDITDSAFRSNSLQDSPARDGKGSSNRPHRGGGLALVSGCTFALKRADRARGEGDPAVLQSGNVFDANVIQDTVNNQAGGGEYISLLETRSAADRFTRNIVHSASAIEEGDDVEGAGLAIDLFGGNTFEGRKPRCCGQLVHRRGNRRRDLSRRR